ncbi:MMPL family transporter [Aeromicrobium fastidiosum]|uniref:MMPL family transporter n=1 Tax=Aeromicrobium fastidiosum TaxID=52699 RepID=A0A641AME8_9ACTN|nr:MMPL family transporter [Aeromicrobium fastidiosum]KAA1376448.1 MMPL family transporter [Aeromicrobium fastidiosum]MBP2391637.1 RND superfamily putative drug exporter [Aeromicrobium fastidiosum]
MSNSLYALGRWAFRHPGRVLASWVLVLLVTAIAAVGLGGGTKNSFEIPGTESQEAIDSLGRTFPELSGTSAYLVVVADRGRTVDDAETRRLVTDAIAGMKKVEGVTEAVSPYDESNTIGVSPDRRAAQVQIQFDRELTDVTPAERDQLVDTGDALKAAGYTTAFGGDVFTSTGPQLSIVEVIGVVVAFIVLFLMFRSLRAAVMPIVTALLGVLVTMAITIALTGFITISATAPLLALMIGLAVGIDYALFIVSRHREQLADGLEPEEAAARSVATAGSAVVFAGVTVVIALLGLSIARIPFLTIMGAVAALSVVIAVAVALTVLPALLGRAGDKLTPGTGHRPGAFSRRWVTVMTRFPLIAIVVVVVGLAIAAVPAKDLQLALPDNGTAPVGSTQRTAYDLVDEHFGPGYNGPLLVSIDIISTTDPVGVVNDIADDLRTMPGVAAIGLATPNRTADTGIVQVVPTTGATDEATAALVREIRDREPQWRAEYGVPVAVTGLTAGGIDVSERLQGALLPFGIVVVGLSVLLLMIVFRSLVVPLKATIGFLLSTGASFGAVVAVFQWGWLMHAIHLEQTGPLISFLPIILMAVLFGLSMDYEVFLMARMKEEYVRSGDPHRAIVDGFVGSSRVVTAAAVIMLAVFAAFVPEGDPNIKPIAFALAVGVFVDAFLIRMLFAPAVLEIFGRRAWTLPAGLDRRLPHVDVEGEGLHRRVELQAWPRPASTAAITAASVTTQGPDGLVLNDVSVEVEAGDWLVVHGPSGAGKTALLLTFAGRMAFDTGRLRVNGHLLPQEASRVRHSVALAELTGVNDLEDNLTVDQHIAERLSIRSFGLWVSRNRVAPILAGLNRALEIAHDEAGIPFEPVDGSALVSSLSRLERKLLGVVLALTDAPRIVIVDDADDLRAAEHIDLLWSALAALLDGRDVTLVASVASESAAPPPSARLHHLELDTHRTLHELMLP